MQNVCISRADQWISLSQRGRERLRRTTTIVNGLSDKVSGMRLDEKEGDENSIMTQGDGLRQRKAARQSRSATTTTNTTTTRYSNDDSPALNTRSSVLSDGIRYKYYTYFSIFHLSLSCQASLLGPSLFMKY
eukprot:sb/3474956/